MNWYKRIIYSQQTLDKPSYLEVGHNIKETNPNLMWVYYDGNVIVHPETEKYPTHANAFEYIYLENMYPDDDNYGDKLYQGRYEANTGKLSIIVPPKGVRAFRSVPSSLINKLYQKFPNITQIYTY